MRHASMSARASATLANQCSFRHSPRNLPLKLSTKAFSIGLPGRMKPAPRRGHRPRFQRAAAEFSRSTFGTEVKAGQVLL